MPDIFNEFWEFLSSAAPAFWTVVGSGIFFGIDQYAEHSWPSLHNKLNAISPAWRRGLTILVLFGGAIVGGFQAWRVEHGKLRDANKTIEELTQQVRRKTEVSVVFECRYLVEPKGMQTINTMELWPYSLEVGGLAQRGSLHGDVKMSMDNIVPAFFQCKMINYGSETLLHLRVAPRVVFLDDKFEDNAHRQSAIFKDGHWPIYIERIDPGPNAAFTFYIQNNSDKFAHVQMADVGLASLVDSRQVNIHVSTSATSQDITLGPINAWNVVSAPVPPAP